MKKKKNKKTILIVVGVIVVVIVAFLIFSNGSSDKIYEVGKDIDAGEYVLVGTKTYTIDDVSDEDYGYYEICTNKECNADNGDIETNDNVLGKAYIVVEDGQYLKTNSMKLYKVSEYESNVENSISYNYNFGFNSYYKVGKDLSAGTYTFTGDSFYYAVCSKPSCDALNGEVITNEHSDNTNNSSTITLSDGQYLVVSGTDPFTATKNGG